MGSSATTKSTAVTYLLILPALGSTELWPLFNDGTSGDDNVTVTGITGVALGAGDGSITHLIVCPRNEVGAATSCANAALNDRGFGATITNALDNVTRVFITPGASTSFEVVTADGSSDNVTATQAITDTKSTTTAPTFGTASTVVTEATGFSAIMDTGIHGSTLYTLTAKDNGTLTACTSGSCSTSASPVFVSTVTDRIVLDSDGTNMIGIADNGTNIAVYNLTTPGTLARVDVNIVTQNTGDQFCGAVGGGRVVVFNDNESGVVAGVLNSSGVDNTTAWEYTGAIASIDNTTLTTDCSMIYGGISGDNRTFYMAIANNTSTLLYSIIDNTTALTVSLAATVSSTTADSLAIDADSNGVP